MRVVIAEPFADAGVAVLESRGLHVIACAGRSREELLAELHDAQGLIVRSETRVDRDLIASASQLRVVGRAGVGVDAIDVQAATQAGILVLNTPEANTLAATEHTFALMLAVLRHIPAASESLRSGRWDRSHFTGNELAGKTLGVIGLGRIGGAVSTRARAFEMNVLAYDPFVPAVRAASLGVQQTSLEMLVERADVVTLHVPLTPQTRGMIDAALLARMKRTAVVVNCARGGVIDEEALLQALDDGVIRAAAVDVVAQEPPAPGSPGARLHAHPKVVATPHLGGSTYESLERIALQLAGDVADALRGRPAAGAVNAPAATGADAHRVRAYVEAADALGRLAPQIFGAAAMPMRLHLQGDIAGSNAEPLRAAFLAAYLQTTSDRRVSIVNSIDIADEIGLTLEISSDSSQTAYSSLVTVYAGTHRVAATMLAAGPRVVQLDEYDLDAIPHGAWIVTRHDDIPGMVGRVGTILGERHINISTMQVARSERAALMVLAVDPAPARDVLDALRALPHMHRVDAAVL